VSGNKFLDSIQRKRGEFKGSLILRFRLLWSRFSAEGCANTDLRRACCEDERQQTKAGSLSEMLHRQTNYRFYWTCL